MALSDAQQSCEFTSALETEPEIGGRAAAATSVEFDPIRTSAVLVNGY